MFPAGDYTAAGIIFGQGAPPVHVVRLNGACYLHNGFHRVYGAKLAGASHVPCVFRDVLDPAMAGINPPGTFDLTTFQGVNPPSVGHFTLGRALDVTLRAMSRVLHISWAQYVIPIE